MLSLKFPSSIWMGALVLAEELRGNCYVYPLRRNQGSALSLHYCFLTAPPLFLHSLPSLVGNCLNLPFRTLRKSRRLKPFSYKHEPGLGKAFVPGKAPKGPACFQFLFRTSLACTYHSSVEEAGMDWYVMGRKKLTRIAQ